MLSLVALGARGTYSPVVFGGAGLLLIFWGRISNSAQFSVFRPVRESVIMKMQALPFLWFALAEVKFTGRNVATALASIDERIVITAYDKPAVYVLLRGFEASRNRAEAKLLEKMRKIEMTIAPLGAYLLPIDSMRAADRMGFTTRPVKVDPDALEYSLFTLPHEILSIRPKDGHVDSIGVFLREEDRRQDGEIIVPAPRQKPTRRPLLWQTLRLVERKLKWPEADAQTAFLGSLFATREEPIGERITEMESLSSTHVTVKSIGSRQIELSRVQLRALMRVYAPTVQ